MIYVMQEVARNAFVVAIIIMAACVYSSLALMAVAHVLHGGLDAYTPRNDFRGRTLAIEPVREYQVRDLDPDELLEKVTRLSPCEMDGGCDSGHCPGYCGSAEPGTR